MSDFEESQQLHREALHAIVHDMARWLTKRTETVKSRAALLRRKGRLPEARCAAEQADVYEEAKKKLQELRREHGETSARQSFLQHRFLEGAQTDPTPEEIEEAKQQIQSAWTESDRERRRAEPSIEPVELKPTNFIF